MKLFLSKKRTLFVVAVFMLMLFFLRPGAGRLKSRIAGSIGAAMGRSVEIGKVRIRLLRPGFDLENLVVYDDGAFGAEPMLRAAEVTADLRLSSLLRGRIEIARLDLAEPSLNLVHGADGRWNYETLLERASQIPLAPTARKSEPRPRFPYITGSSGRINFKLGQVKKPYALINADFSLWQDSENAWGVRLKAQPFRGDLNLSDTGTVWVNGSWQRASTVRQTPLQFSFEWDRAQLGQLTKFVSGNDKGWRGALQLNLNLSGTPEQLQVSSDASVGDFRRYDILSGGALRLAAHCDGRYSSSDHMLHEVFCRAPVGSGVITLHGDMGLPGSHSYDLVLVSEGVPAGALVAVAQHAKKNVPDDLTASGAVEGSLSMRGTADSETGTEWMGSGEIATLHFGSESNKVDVDAGNVPFLISSAPTATWKKARGVYKQSRNSFAPALDMGPFSVPLGRDGPTTARIAVNRSGYQVSLSGAADIANALRVARVFGLPTMNTNADGAAQLNLQVTGGWAGLASGDGVAFSQPLVTGTAKLRRVRFELREMEDPIEISSADLLLSAEEARVMKLTANAAQTIWTGSISLPRGCASPGVCLVHFNLNTNETGVSRISGWLHPQPKRRAWYQVLGPTAKSAPSFLKTVNAEGEISAGRLQIGQVTATHAAATASLKNGKLRLSGFRADLLGGKHNGEWLVDFSEKPATYGGSGTFNGISLTMLSSEMKDEWITGTADGNYQLRATGLTPAEFWLSARGGVKLAMRNGMLPHITLEDEGGPLRVIRFDGEARLHDGRVEMSDGRLSCAQGLYRVSGTALFSRELDLKLRPETDVNSARVTTGAYAITGTIADPKVAPIAGETQAALKR